MTVKWYGNQFLAELEVKSEGLLNKTARQVEALTKVGITNLDLIDTGFMRNTVYSATSKSSTSGETWSDGRYPDKTGEPVERQRAAEMKPAEGEAIVHVAAAYYLYHELKHSILYKALVEASNQAGE